MVKGRAAGRRLANGMNKASLEPDAQVQSFNATEYEANQTIFQENIYGTEESILENNSKVLQS